MILILSSLHLKHKFSFMFVYVIYIRLSSRQGKHQNMMVESILHNQRTWVWVPVVIHRCRILGKSPHFSKPSFCVSRKLETTNIKVWASAWMIRLNIVTISIIYKLFNAIRIKILAGFFCCKINEVILKFI